MTTSNRKYEPAANLLVPSHQLGAEVPPSSFAHFLIQSQAAAVNSQNQQSLAFGYLPYELYNCTMQPSDAVGQQQQQHQLVTLIAGKNQHSAPITTTTANASNNSRLLTFIDNKVKPNQNANLYDTQQPDHVYCEIPSTLTRLPPRDAAHQHQQQFFNLNQQQHQHQPDDSSMFLHFGQHQHHLKSPRGTHSNATLSTANGGGGGTKYNASII